MKYLYLILMAVGFCICSAFPACGQGQLQPPADALSNGVPVAIMKSIDQVEPRKVIDRLPFTIVQPGSYYLISNLVGHVNAHGITISCGDVKLDLSGFALNGISGSLNAIFVSSTGPIDNISIRNGVIRNWGPGVANSTSGFAVMATNAPDLVLTDLKAFGNSCGGFYAGDNAWIERCAAYGNGFYAKSQPNPPLDSGMYCGYYGTFKDCKTRSNRGAGIYLSQHAKVSNCTSSENNADGIKGDNFCTVRDCQANMNKSQGITIFNMCKVQENTCAMNGFNMMGQQIDPNGVGIRIAGSNNVVEKNVLVKNAAYGINNLSPGNLVIGNYANGNRSNDFNFAVGGYRGQILTPQTGQDITNSNPWANFIFN